MFTQIINAITPWIVVICGIVIIGGLIYKHVRTKQYKKERTKKLGYETLSVKQQVNILKSKVAKQVELGVLPSAIAVAYNELNIDSPEEYAHWLNGLCKAYSKKKGYYKKNPSENVRVSQQIQLEVGQYKVKHAKQFKKF